MHVDDVAGLERHRLDDGPGDVGAGGAPGDAEDRAPGVGVPPRAAQAGERGHQDHAVAVGHRGRQRADLGRALDDAEAVAQPLHGGAGDEDRALVGVGELGLAAGAGQRPRHRGEQPVDRARDSVVPTFTSTKLPVP